MMNGNRFSIARYLTVCAVLSCLSLVIGGVALAGSTPVAQDGPLAAVIVKAAAIEWSPLDANGVALAAIQALDRQVAEKDVQIAEQEARIQALEGQVQALAARLQAVEAGRPAAPAGALWGQFGPLALGLVGVLAGIWAARRKPG